MRIITVWTIEPSGRIAARQCLVQEDKELLLISVDENADVRRASRREGELDGVPGVVGAFVGCQVRALLANSLKIDR